MADLNDLFGDLGAPLVEDFKHYGVMAAGAVGGKLAFDMLASKLPLSSIPVVGEHLPKALPFIEIAAGIFGGNFVGRYNARLGQGLAVGLVADGLVKAVKAFAPDAAKSIGLQGLGAGDVYGSDDLFNRYLNAAPVEVETVNGAPMTVEEMSGLNGVGSFIG